MTKQKIKAGKKAKATKELVKPKRKPYKLIQRKIHMVYPKITLSEFAERHGLDLERDKNAEELIQELLNSINNENKKHN